MAPAKLFNPVQTSIQKIWLKGPPGESKVSACNGLPPSASIHAGAWVAGEACRDGLRLRIARTPPVEKFASGRGSVQVRIYKPAQSAMQSGRGRGQRWVLEFEPQTSKQTDPLMGWVGGTDTRHQVMLLFDSQEEAIAYAGRYGYSFVVMKPHKRSVRPKSYADNFRIDRLV